MVVFRDVLPLGYQALEDFPAPKTLYLLPLPSALGAHLTGGYHGTLFQTPGPAAVLTKVLLWGRFLGTRPDGPQLLSSVSLVFIFHYSIQPLPPAPRGVVTSKPHPLLPRVASYMSPLPPPPHSPVLALVIGMVAAPPVIALTTLPPPPFPIHLYVQTYIYSFLHKIYFGCQAVFWVLWTTSANRAHTGLALVGLTV